MKRSKSIFDKIGALIPGYRGYAERDSRRNCDKLIRNQISEKLSECVLNINNKINTSKENISWGRKPVDPLSGFSNKPEGLEKYVFAVKKGMRILGITDDMVREMYSLQLISEEEFNKW